MQLNEFFHRKFLPFCVRTGAPELREPAIDNALATVDILFDYFVKKIRKKSYKKILALSFSTQTKCIHSK